MSKILCVLYPDPENGYPNKYPRDDIPKLSRYPDGQQLPTPRRIDFKPGALLGSESGELGLRKFLEENGHRLVVTTDKMVRAASLNENCPMPRLSSRNRSGRLT
jgi:formate dehydrogenase